MVRRDGRLSVCLSIESDYNADSFLVLLKRKILKKSWIRYRIEAGQKAFRRKIADRTINRLHTRNYKGATTEEIVEYFKNRKK